MSYANLHLPLGTMPRQGLGWLAGYKPPPLQPSTRGLYPVWPTKHVGRLIGSQRQDWPGLFLNIIFDPDNTKNLVQATLKPCQVIISCRYGWPSATPRQPGQLHPKPPPLVGWPWPPRCGQGISVQQEFGAQSTEILVFPSPTSYMLTPFVFRYYFGVHSLDSSKVFDKFSRVLYFTNYF